MKTGGTTRAKRQVYFNNKGKEITTVNDSFPITEDGIITGAVEIAKDITQLEQVIRENVMRKKNTKFTFDRIISQSEEIQNVIEEAKRSTRTTSSVLLVGETGTGKELFAQSIHNGSSRSNQPFQSQNCAAIPDTLIESILFGTTKGAFTGAIDRPGLFEQADGGTLLLDEINSLSPPLQAKLLRVIQEKTIRRVGDTRDREVDVRIIATINEDPIDAVQENRLRRDLYYRIGVVTLIIPPLRKRKRDLPLLAGNFIQKYNQLFHMNVQRMNEDVKTILFQHDWPGNVRELEHMIEGMMNRILGEETIEIYHLPSRFRNRLSPDREPVRHEGAPSLPRKLKTRMAEIEKSYVEQALEESGRNISHAAKTLGISRQSLQYRLKKQRDANDS
ncbi:arginine utilization regulatory protein [Salimicrobium flavidum]|uniref:Arginine utilization regulatory protein n=1 Tax=Salimicrobium flavidum TaxID=570947 RepID=A0A1N7KRB5_9BACI|nr:arginine utilization regulatory protein [Salimicrobium flavidum]